MRWALVLVALCGCDAILGITGTTVRDGGVSAVPDANGLFAITAPASARVLPGDTVDVTITVQRMGAFHGTVTIANVDDANGVTAEGYSFDDPDDTKRLTLTAAASAPLGVHLVTVSGAAGGVTATASIAVLVQGPSGTPDSTFGTDGASGTSGATISGRAPDQVTAVAVDAHGDIVIGGTSGGNWIVVRLDPSGALDRSFAAGQGYVDGPPGNLGGLTIDSDDGIVAVGTYLGHIAAARWTDAGTLDTDFGTAGVTQIPAAMASNGTGVGIAIDPQSGDIYLAGYATAGGRLCSLGRGGNLRSEFADGGCLAVGEGILNAVAIGPDRGIGVGGQDANGLFVANVTLAGNAPSLQSAAEFGVDGTTASAIVAVAAQGSQRFVVGGYINGTAVANRDTLVARLAGGTPDRTFSAATEVPGIATVGIYGLHQQVTALAIADDESVIVVGYGEGGVNGASHGGVLRLTPDGLPDPSFGNDGLTLTGPMTTLTAVALQPDGRIVAVGALFPSGFGALRLWP